MALSHSVARKELLLHRENEIAPAIPLKGRMRLFTWDLSYPPS